MELSEKNKIKQEVARNILEMLHEFYEEKDYLDTNEYLCKVSWNIEHEYLFLSDYTNDR